MSAISLLSASNNASSDAQADGSASTRVIIATGTWGGGTLTLEYSHDGTTFVSSGQTLTANGVISFQDRPGMTWRVTLAGATGGSITATAY
jgi:hypothetical protein